MTANDVMTSIQEPVGSPDLDTARARNEATFRASAVAMYAGDIETFLEYWTADGRYEVAYPVPGVPAVVEGHDTFRQLFGGLTSAAREIRVHDVHFHQTVDPNVAFVEEKMVADLHGGGRYENTLALRVTFRDGLIREIFEYYGEVAHADFVAGLGASR